MNVGKWMSKSISAPVQQTVCSCGNNLGKGLHPIINIELEVLFR